jgi:zinc protease
MNNGLFVTRLLLFFLFLFYSSVTYAETKFIGESQIVPNSPLKAYEYQLDNGLKFIVIPDQRNSIATIHFMLHAGSNTEHLGTTGLAHFFEHIMFRKTKDAPEGNYDRVLSSVGGSGNAATSDSFVTFYSNFPAPALESMLKLESDRFKHLDLIDPYFTTEKGAVISERKLRVENDPMQRTQEILRSITERNTPMEWMTIGSKSDVEHMTLESAQKFYENFYTPDNTLMVIGGPFQTKEVVKSVETHFSDWTGKVTKIKNPLPADYFTRDLNQSFVCSAPILTKQYQIVYPSGSDSLKDTVYAMVFQAVLDDNPEGTFDYRLIKENLATRFYFYKTYWQDQTNPLVVNFQLNSNQKFEKVKSFWIASVEQVSKKNISEKIKNQVIKQLRVDDAQTAERMTTLANSILENTFFFHDFYASGKAEKIVQNITTKDFKEWIHSNLSKSFVTGVVPTGEADSCTELYQKFYSKK